jgi:[acyl-carrier-protein] S-malonyltransferase
MTFAFVFPGQGSQAVGMGRDLASRYPAAKAVFDEVDDALGERLSAIMWEGPADTLTLTRNAQPALMAVSLAAYRTLETEFGEAARPALAAGHSLGEYSALAAAGVFRIGDAARLLRLRGDAMQEAVPAGQGAMIALLGAELDQAEKLAAQAAAGDVCQVANDNAPGQVVLSGSKAACDRAVASAPSLGIRRVVPLPVSAPFHCALMQPAADRMREALAKAAMTPPRFPIVTNVTADAVSDVEKLRSLLVQQVTGMVRWRESVSSIAKSGVKTVVEVGAGRVLTGLVRRIDPALETLSVGTADEAAAFGTWLTSVTNA